MILLEDTAQGFGGEYTRADGTKMMDGSLGIISDTSFFPANPLGCYGDGGAIFTDGEELNILCRSIAIHGKDMELPEDSNAKYNNIRLDLTAVWIRFKLLFCLPSFQLLRMRSWK